jgi:hypothetical protein
METHHTARILRIVIVNAARGYRFIARSKYVIAGALLIGLLLGSLLKPTHTDEALGALAIPQATVQDIALKQEEYFQKYGTYLQVLEDGSLPVGMNGTVKNKLGIAVPFRVDTYGDKRGQGFQLILEDASGTVSIGFGPEATERSYIQLKEIYAASTTP